MSFLHIISISSVYLIQCFVSIFSHLLGTNRLKKKQKDRLQNNRGSGHLDYRYDYEYTGKNIWFDLCQMKYDCILYVMLAFYGRHAVVSSGYREWSILNYPTNVYLIRKSRTYPYTVQPFY